MWLDSVDNWDIFLASKSNYSTKAELLQLNRTQFSFLEIFINKIKKTKTTFIISVLKVIYLFV